MTRTDLVVSAPVGIVRQKAGWDDWVMRAGLVVLGLYLAITIVLPLWSMLSKSLEDHSGAFVGLANYSAYASNPVLVRSILNSLTVAGVTTAITLALAFVYAYGLTRSRMPGRGLFRAVAMIPLLAPSLLPAISLIYLFGNQGVIRDWLMGWSVYGPIGIVMGEVFYTFPHALMILTTALAVADQRLYEAADCLGATRFRRFMTVTLPGARYGLVSAGFVVFTLVMTDFGVPKVIGGSYDVLATDVYKQVVGQQNFQMGAVVSAVLLIPAILAFAVDRIIQRRQVSQLGGRAVSFRPSAEPLRDWTLFAVCAAVALVLLAMLGMAGFASLVKFWPYNLELGLRHYSFDLMDGGGWGSYWNSLKMASWTAVIGTAVIFTGAWMIEKSRGAGPLRTACHLLAMLPMAVPGLVLGLAYIFFFNPAGNPLSFLYGTLAILVMNSIAHFYTVSHLTAVTALKQIDPEFESVSASLKIPAYTTFLRVTVPVCLPAILGISIYLFINAMTTVSGVVFLYSPDTTLASIAVLNMDDAGDIAPAAAMAMMIVYTSAAVKLIHATATGGLLRVTQRWRAR
ncbi:phosphonate ABC transporter permease [Skermanella stibiiresistens SB22]|uniref:Phosphonate ABC transporter permease n=1 Tax=Skermanella stibiiresistens SB22 TaxID=1385369 RepID=W9H8I1_9PROT|nr:putative 2-aminoethylphosphonate ABC transporter permease subunit [Skermanella stibiiresistens]EWY42560.1 phosphonate ABC transporter permease [Skermanella stibiiresistens SB22]